MRRHLWLALLLAAATILARAQPAGTNATSLNASVVIEAAGQVEYASAGGTNWLRAVPGVGLRPGDRVRTREESRAAIQLSDRSVVRLNEHTTLEILPPRRAEKRRFGLSWGSLFFFNREKPADIEFDTPLAAGAIRGTEFLLAVAEADSSLRLALMDGAVTLQTAQGEVALDRGHELVLERGQPARSSVLTSAVGAIQWALYYPAVLDPDELKLDAADARALSQVLNQYRAGDLLSALKAWPAGGVSESAETQTLRAALELAVGRVANAEQSLSALPRSSHTVDALRELIATVKQASTDTNSAPASASGWLARSYALQARADLPGARGAARRAVELAPQNGLAHARLAEMEFAFGERTAALAALDRAAELSPRHAPALALRGFVLVERGDFEAALKAFDQARELDAAFGPAWLGRGLCLLPARQPAEARQAFQAAAALEPQRGLFRSYFGKAASELGDARAAEKEFRLARELDPQDPTGWLYSALHLWQQHRINEALRDLEHSAELNDARAPFRSRLLLDADRSVRSANLAALYDDAGLPDVCLNLAARSVVENYANFSGHLFMANGLQARESSRRYDLRLETARQSEMLVANLLAPVGGGNLSQQLSQQEHLRFFEPRPVGFSSLTEFRSNGEWHEGASVYGTLGGLSYALDGAYESVNGQSPSADFERRQVALTLRQRVSANDELYFQAGYLHSDSENLAGRYDPTQAKPGFHAREVQEPTLYAGWHHTWSPGSHTLLLVSRLDDRLSLHDPQADVIFVRESGGVITEVQAPPYGPPVNESFNSHFTLWSVEAQQSWETPKQSLIVGGRWQTGSVDTHSVLTRELSGVLTDQQVDGSLERGNVYAYHTWRIAEPLRLITGLSYDRITYPENVDLPPISRGEVTRDLVAPKAGLLFTPWQHGLLRASYAQSLGGLYFDNSVRLEPAQVAGFNQAFRSLLPESVAGLVPGTKFELAGAGFEQSFATGTWLGVEAEWLTSDGWRQVGTFTNFLPILNAPSSTREVLDYRERNLSLYVSQLLGNWFSVSARYRLSEATWRDRFPDLPAAVSEPAGLQANRQATLQRLSLSGNFAHPSGVFAQWESAWYRQHNAGYVQGLADEDLWQHNFVVGYRFPRRHAEVRVGVLNLADTDYRLNPLNFYADLPRSRTLFTSLRLNW